MPQNPAVAGLKAASPFLQRPVPPTIRPNQEPIPAKWAMEEEPPAPDGWVGGALRKVGQGVSAGTAALMGLMGVDDSPTGQARDMSGWNGAGQLAGAAIPFAHGLPGMYSRLEEAVSKLPSAMKGSSALNALRKFAHPEEIATRGVGQFLEGRGANPVNKADIQALMEQNPIELHTTTLGEPTPWYEQNRDTNASGHGPEQTVYNTYQMPGSSNYRETLIRTPLPPAEEAYHAGSHSRMEDLIHQTTTPDIGYQSQHFPDHPNTLAFVRHNERNLPTPPDYQFPGESRLQELNNVDASLVGLHDQPAGLYGNPTLWDERAALLRDKNEASRSPQGPRVRNLENVQSDWHQEGAKFGYEGDPPEPPVTKAMIKPGYRLQYSGGEDGPMWAVVDHRPDSAVFPAPDGGSVEGSTAWHPSSEDAIREHLGMPPSGVDLRVPDAPFKDNRWADLALKQQVLDVAGRPDLEGITITPGSESMRRGESLSPQFHDQVLPTKLGKILAPFGGKMEQVPTGIPKSPTSGPGSLGTFGNQVVKQGPTHDNTDFKEIASLWPRPATELRMLNFPRDEPLLFPSEQDAMQHMVQHWGGSGMTRQAPVSQADMQALLGQVREHNPEVGGQLQQWLARLSPEMKAAILKKGLPLLSLYGMMQGLQNASPVPNEGQ